MRRLAAVILSTGLLLTGCSSGSGQSAAPPNSAAGSSAPVSANTIVIKNFAFSPASLTVSPGSTVTVTNDDSVTHTVTATGAKAFDTGDVAPGKTVTFTAPNATGSYSYICTIHQYMHGTLIVK